MFFLIDCLNLGVDDTLVPRAQCYKTFLVRNKIECLFLASLPSRYGQEPTLERMKGSSLQGRLLSFPTNID
jgi:hypothetical protein